MKSIVAGEEPYISSKMPHQRRDEREAMTAEMITATGYKQATQRLLLAMKIPRRDKCKRDEAKNNKI